MKLYIAEIYCGRAYLGNGIFETFEECFEFANNDSFCDKIKIYDPNEDAKRTFIKHGIMCWIEH